VPHRIECPAPQDCQVIELRQYTLHPGQRDVLIELFDREFVETQEACGMTVLGQFRDLDRPDRFVWLRGFSGMEERRQALEAFYGGPVWAAHRDRANATMAEFDDVLLLRPAWPGAGWAVRQSRLAPAGSGMAAGLLDATVFHLAQGAGAELLRLVQDVVQPLLAQAGARAQGWYVTEPSENTFARLPVRTGEQVLVGLALFDDAQALAQLAGSGRWARQVAPLLQPFLAQRPPQAMRLAPTPRSAIRL